MPDEPLRHHDLCFGCGQANLFGLQLELRRAGDGVEGRFFVKQDHQGPDGHAHAGVLAAALEEALAHAGGGPPTHLDLQLIAPVPVGAFVHVSASPGEGVLRDEEGGLLARAVGRSRALDT